MENANPSKLVKQLAIFAIVFAIAFFGTRYLVKHYKTSNQTVAPSAAEKTEKP